MLAQAGRRSRRTSREDVMLYAFLLYADPGGVSPESLAERFLDRKLNAAAEQQAEATLTCAEHAAAADRRAGTAAAFIARSICRWRPFSRAWR